MFKLILTVKRRPGLTLEQFKHHYETQHAPLAWSALTPNLVRYVRNHVNPVPGHPEPEFDVATEFWFRDREAYEASSRFAHSVEGQILARDEERFMDRSTMRAYFSDECETKARQ